MILLPALISLSLLSFIAGEMLLLTVQQQRIINNYMQAAKIARELELDLWNLRHAQKLQYSLISSQQYLYIADNPSPLCTTGVNIYQIELTHRKHVTYSMLAILQQRSDRASGFLGSLNVTAMHF